MSDRHSDRQAAPDGQDPLAPSPLTDDPLAGPRIDPLSQGASASLGVDDPLALPRTDPLGGPAGGAPADDDEDTIRKRPRASEAPATEGDGPRFISWAATHVGTVRKHNEDSLVDRPDLGLWAVADGAGGHSRGDVASRLVADALESLPRDLTAGELLSEIRNRMNEANAQLRASVTPPEISATTVVVLIARGEHYACLWAGDSRAYLLRDGTMSQITRDHSLVQEMVDAGHIRAEDAESHPNANVITRAVGSNDELDLDKVSDRLLPGDRFLLCSDGLCKTLPDSLTASLLAAPDDPTGRLIQATLDHRGRDNVTAVVVDVLR